jgi:hypothetical protein
MNTPTGDNKLVGFGLVDPDEAGASKFCLRREVEEMNELKYPAAEWKGSTKTYEHVKQEIAQRWGPEEAEKYDPLVNCFTLSVWNSKGYMVNEGERAIQSYTFVDENVTDEAGETKTIHVKHMVNLFFSKQVHKINP